MKLHIHLSLSKIRGNFDHIYIPTAIKRPSKAIINQFQGTIMGHIVSSFKTQDF